VSPTVTRLGHGPALFKTSRRRDADAGGRSAHKWIWAILAIALALLIAVVVKFNEKKNPTPSRTTHNTMLEVAWTIVPVLILVAIAIPSFRVLRTQLSDPKADLMVKVIGHAWYWSYEYPQDVGGFKFDANLLEGEDQVKSGQPKLLATDNEMVVPVNKVVRIQTTGADVIHSFAVPAFGVIQRKLLGVVPAALLNVAAMPKLEATEPLLKRTMIEPDPGPFEL